MYVQHMRAFGWWLLDGLIILIALGLAALDIRGFSPVSPPAYLPAFVTAIVYALILLTWKTTLLGFAHWPSHRRLQIAWACSKALVVGTVAAVILSSRPLMPQPVISGVLAFFWPLNLLVSSRIGSLPRQFGRGIHVQAQRTILIGADDSTARIPDILQSIKSLGFRVVGIVQRDLQSSADAGGAVVPGVRVLGCSGDIRRIISEHAIDQAIIVLPNRQDHWVEEVVAELQDFPIEIRILPPAPYTLMSGTAEGPADPFNFGVSGPVMSNFEWVIKRALDILVSGFALILLTPLLLIVAVAIKLDSPGPIIFKQMRVGQGGVLFPMFKFRSMGNGADAELRDGSCKRSSDGKPIHKKQGDPRVTRVGRIIRHASIDELPQLINVLVGQMSLVGPRPEIPYIVQFYVPRQWARFAVPQGITGWWQINARGDSLMYLNPKYDLHYVTHYSLWLDLQILLKTAVVVISGRGAF